MVLIPAGEFWMGNTPEGLDPIRDFCKRVPKASVCRGKHYERDELPPPARDARCLLPRSRRGDECPV